MNWRIDPLIEVAWAQFWQITIVAAVVAIVVRLFCQHRPHLAYLLWMLVIAKCIIPPVWSSPTGIFSWARMRVIEPASSVDTFSIADLTLGRLRFVSRPDVNAFEGMESL